VDAAISPPPAARLDGWSRERLSGCSSRQSAPANEVPPNDDEQEAVADNPYSGPLLVSLSRSVVSVQVGEATLSSTTLDFRSAYERICRPAFGLAPLAHRQPQLRAVLGRCGDESDGNGN
jgi:hypothetical protein